MRQDTYQEASYKCKHCAATVCYHNPIIFCLYTIKPLSIFQQLAIMNKLVRRDNKILAKKRTCLDNLQPILTLCTTFAACNLTIKENSLRFTWWKTIFCVIVVILSCLHLIAIPGVVQQQEKSVSVCVCV